MKTTASTAAILAALLLAPTASAQDTTSAVGGYEQLDADRSGALSAQEFRPYVDRTYDAWDTNADDLLGEEEFWSGLYGTWDENRDAILVEEEFERGYADWFSDIDVEQGVGYATTLGGTDEGLTEQDFVAGASGTGLYEAWTDDEDGMDREGFSARYYDLISGGDDELTQSEFEAFYRGG